jgi:hypothetical protein
VAVAQEEEGLLDEVVERGGRDERERQVGRQEEGELERPRQRQQRDDHAERRPRRERRDEPIHADCVRSRSARRPVSM